LEIGEFSKKIPRTSTWIIKNNDGLEEVSCYTVQQNQLEAYKAYQNKNVLFNYKKQKNRNSSNNYSYVLNILTNRPFLFPKNPKT
jgi:hypothetical protein